MFTTKYLLSVMAAVMLLVSCNIADDNNPCGIYLDFIFDYNMEYADSFNPQVKEVNVYFFDEQDRYIFSKYAQCDTDLINHKQMFLSSELKRGTYKVLAIGGLTNNFRFTDLDDGELIPGVTTLQQVKLSLHRETEVVSNEFQHLWLSEVTTVKYAANHSIWPVHFVRDTNKFNFVLENRNTTQNPNNEQVPYTFRIVTPEAAAYGYENNPLYWQPLTYTPYYLGQGENPQQMAVARINTMRLFNEPDLYRLKIVNTLSGKEVWDYDLMELLSLLKPDNRTDGTGLTMQEFLDRQADWNIVILYRDDSPQPGEEGFLALGVRVNDWIYWFHSIEM